MQEPLYTTSTIKNWSETNTYIKIEPFLKIKIGSKPRFFKLSLLKNDVMKLSQFKSDITNVESVEKRYYEY